MVDTCEDQLEVDIKYPSEAYAINMRFTASRETEFGIDDSMVE
jgi:hypothetical protein